MVMKDSERVEVINNWSQTPSGVLLVTYEMFTNLAELTRLKVGILHIGLLIGLWKVAVQCSLSFQFSSALKGKDNHSLLSGLLTWSTFVQKKLAKTEARERTLKYDLERQLEYSESLANEEGEEMKIRADKCRAQVTRMQ